jgi:predicted transcriptional regulator
MMKSIKIRVAADGTKGYFGRARERARRLDRGEKLEPAIIVSFEDPADMVRVLSAERIRLLRLARQKPTAVSDLAGKLRRDTRAVSRDVDLLEDFGLLQSRYEVNPGHGKRRIIQSPARQYQLLATI